MERVGLKKIIKHKVTKEAIEEINKIRERCGFEPTNVREGDEFEVLLK